MKNGEIFEANKKREALSRDLKDTAKKAESVPELRNKIILLESRVRESENTMRQEAEAYDAQEL